MKMETYKFEVKIPNVKKLTKMLAMERISSMNQSILSGRRFSHDCFMDFAGLWISNLDQVNKVNSVPISISFWKSNKMVENDLGSKLKKLNLKQQIKCAFSDGFSYGTTLALIFLISLFSGKFAAEKSSEPVQSLADCCETMTLTLTRVPCPAVAVDSLEEVRSRSPLNEPRSIRAGSDQPDSGSIPPMLYNIAAQSRIRRDDLVGSLLQNDFRIDFKMLITNTNQEDWLKELELCVNGEVHSYSPEAVLPSILTGEACLAAAGGGVLKTFEFIKTPLLQAELGSGSPEINGP